MTSEANPSHSPLFLGLNMEKGKFTNFKNSHKINKNSCNDNFFAVVIRGKRKFMLAEKIWGVRGTLMNHR